uniref:asparaginase n=1 Tax=Guillardia theta TaxID=55529 RepID=A0A7S4KNY0_GUITH|mmetsp:Transcript_28206/g.91377  ORF Transcript_28206/g.91377 Transcript_28206/m.91377 type:complete len:372 (+) Transcript_28206:248-1363(+)
MAEKVGKGSMPLCLEHESSASVLVVFTGGQMGSRMDENGEFVNENDTPSMLIHDLLSLHRMGTRVDVKEFRPLVDGPDITDRHWTTIACMIGEHYLTYDGFVVVMGTDTLAYTGSALSFMLENLGKTVILTGAQIPLNQPFSDAKRNLLTSISLAASLEVPEVCTFFDNKLFRANRCRKGDSGSLRAFVSPNFPPLATLGISLHLKHNLVLPIPKGRFRVHENMSTRMVVIKMVPTFDIDSILRLASAGTETCRAIVLELFGGGNVSSRDPNLFRALSLAKEKGCIVVVTSQCASGSVAVGSYAVNDALNRVGIVPALDMTTEATCAKLAYLFGKGLSPEQVSRAMLQNLRGELTPLSSRFASQSLLKPRL